MDDIFIIWQHSKSELDTFINILNNEHPKINLKPTIHDSQIDFLDVTIFKGPNLTQNKLDTKVFFKPTDTHELLHRTSYHPRHTFSGIIKSQILRFKRICSNKTDFDHAFRTLFRALKHRGYSQRFLRKIKNDTLWKLKSQNRSSKCNKNRCKACIHMEETDTVKCSKGSIIPVKDSLNCGSKSLIYVIKCRNCNLMYVGETSRTLRERLTEHRATVRNNKDCPISHHFNTICTDINFLSIIPLEHVPKQIETTSLENGDILELLHREQFWIKRLKTQFPLGMNQRKEVPAPIPFCLKYMDKANEINKIVKTFHTKIQYQHFKTFKKHSITIATKRNRNLRDKLVSSTLR